MLTAYQAHEISKMTDNARCWISALETAMMVSIRRGGPGKFCLESLENKTLFPLNSRDYQSLLDWAELFDYEVDRKKLQIKIPGVK